MLLSTLLFLTAAASELPHFQQFCHQQGYGDCFPVSEVHIDHETIAVDNRDPISISQAHVVPITLLGEVGAEFEFQTAWGSGVLIQMPDQVSFTGEIPLEGDVVLHIFPCTDREECTSFGYELHEEPLDVPETESEEMEEESEEMEEEEPADARRRALNSETEAVISRVKSLSTATKSNSRSATFRSGTTHSVHVDSMRRSLDSTAADCSLVTFHGIGFGTFTWTICTVTVRFAFPEPTSYISWYNNYYKDFLTNQAALIVAEFNEAMDSVEPSETMYQMKLEHVDFIPYDESRHPIDECWDYKQANDDSDLTHCIVPDSMSGSTVGSAYLPTQTRTGTGWALWKTMPGNSHSGRHTSVHEFGHNFGAEHVYNGAQGASIMISGSEPGSQNRLLQFETNAQKYDTNTYISNVNSVRQNFPYFANLH